MRLFHLYSGYKVRHVEKSDIPVIKEFLKEYERENELTGLAAEEQPRVYDLLDNMEYAEQFGIFVTVDGKVASLSLGEIVGDTLFVHIEKGLKEYEGIYSFTAQEFAKTFADERVKFINREEDCGDAGLRLSKTQYHPSEIKPKYYLSAKLSFCLIKPPVNIVTERLTVNDITTGDSETYAKLYTDEKVNEFYGYDFREDLGGNAPNGEYFFGFMEKLKKKKVQKYLSIGNILWDPGKLDENFLSLYYFAFFELLIIRSLT